MESELTSDFNLSAATVATDKSIIKRLEAAGIFIDKIEPEALGGLLRRNFKRKIGENSTEPYSDAYMSNVVCAIRRRGKNRYSEQTPFKLGYKRSSYNSLLVHPNSIPHIRTVHEYFLNALSNLKGMEMSTIDMTTAALDTIISVGIVTSTQMRAGMLGQLTIAHLDSIQNGRILPVRGKKQHIPQVKYINQTLYNSMLPSILSALAIRDRYFEGRGKSRDDVEDFITTGYKNSTRRLIRSHPSAIVKNIREIFALLIGEAPAVPLGLKIFRTLTTTQLLSSGFVDVAQSVNGHAHSSTTVTKYNAPEMSKVMDALTKTYNDD